MIVRAAAMVGLLVGSVAAAQEGSLVGRVAAGDTAWTRGDHAAAFRAYDAVVRVDSAYSTRALFRVGMLHAWADRLVQAVACHTLYVRLEPGDLEGRVALGRTLAWASRFPSSLAHFDTVLAREPDYRDAVLGRATTLAWWGRLPAAIAALAAWQAGHAGDGESALLRARFLSWAGRLDEAFALYDSLSGGPGSAEAEKGRARVLAWRGDLGLAEARWRAYVERHPDDVEGWVGLGQVLRWQGRTFAARDALDRALLLDPASSDAREQSRWVRAEVAPGVGVAITRTEDSESNVSTTVEVTGAVAQPWNGRLGGSVRWRSVGQGTLPARVVPAAMGTVQWQPGGGAWTLRADVGAVRYPADLAPETAMWQGGARLVGRVRPRVTVGAGASRAPFDDIVAAAARRMTLTIADAEVGIVLHPRLALGLAGGLGYARGDLARNDRTHLMTALRWTPRRGVHGALTHREVAWDHPVPGVYFAPQRLAITEASARWEWPRDLGLVASGEVGLGAQTVRFDGGASTGRLVPRAGVRVGWRPLPGREVVLGLVYANVAAAGAVTASEYRYGAATLTTRWIF